MDHKTFGQKIKASLILALFSLSTMAPSSSAFAIENMRAGFVENGESSARSQSSFDQADGVASARETLNHLNNSNNVVNLNNNDAPDSQNPETPNSEVASLQRDIANVESELRGLEAENERLNQKRSETLEEINRIGYMAYGPGSEYSEELLSKIEELERLYEEQECRAYANPVDPFDPAAAPDPEGDQLASQIQALTQTIEEMKAIEDPAIEDRQAKADAQIEQLEAELKIIDEEILEVNSRANIKEDYKSALEEELREAENRAAEEEAQHQAEEAAGQAAETATPEVPANADTAEDVWQEEYEEMQRQLDGLSEWGTVLMPSGDTTAPNDPAYDTMANSDAYEPSQPKDRDIRLGEISMNGHTPHMSTDNIIVSSDAAAYSDGYGTVTVNLFDYEGNRTAEPIFFHDATVYSDGWTVHISMRDGSLSIGYDIYGNVQYRNEMSIETQTLSEPDQTGPTEDEAVRQAEEAAMRLAADPSVQAEADRIAAEEAFNLAGELRIREEAALIADRDARAAAEAQAAQDTQKEQERQQAEADLDAANTAVTSAEQAVQDAQTRLSEIENEKASAEASAASAEAEAVSAEADAASTQAQIDALSNPNSSNSGSGSPEGAENGGEGSSGSQPSPEEIQRQIEILSSILIQHNNRAQEARRTAKAAEETKSGLDDLKAAQALREAEESLAKVRTAQQQAEAAARAAGRG